MPSRRRVLRTCAVAGLTGAAGCLSDPGTDPTTTRTQTPADPGGVAWEQALTDTVSGRPALDGDRLLVGTEGGTVAALSRGDGSVQWQYESEKPVRGTPAVVGDAVLAVGGGVESGGHDTFHALDERRGETAWEYAGDDEVTTPTVGTDRAYHAEGDSVLALAV